MIHPNSFNSYEQRGKEYEVKVELIKNFYRNNMELSFTDREVKNIMVREGIINDEDMNMYRPKITGLIKAGFLYDTHQDVLDESTRRMVRKVKWNTDDKKIEEEKFAEEPVGKQAQFKYC